MGGSHAGRAGGAQVSGLEDRSGTLRVPVAVGGMVAGREAPERVRGYLRLPQALQPHALGRLFQVRCRAQGAVCLGQSALRLPGDAGCPGCGGHLCRVQAEDQGGERGGVAGAVSRPENPKLSLTRISCCTIIVE